MAKTQHHAEFAVNLQLEQDAIKTFIELLENEQKALVQGKIEILDQFASQKKQIINHLSNFSAKREKFIVAHGLSLNTKDYNQLVTSEEKDTEVNSVWTELLRLAKNCKTTKSNEWKINYSTTTTISASTCCTSKCGRYCFLIWPNGATYGNPKLITGAQRA